MADSLPTIRDVALKAGVSAATVSRVLRGESHYIRPDTIKQVQRAANELSYQPNLQAAALRVGRTYVIALILSDISNPFWPGFARGVQHVARLEGYQVVLANTDWERESELEYLSMAQRARFDGIIINPGQVTNADLVKSGIPTVVAGGEPGFADFDVINGDTEHGSLTALCYFHELGHRRIGFIGLSTQTSSGQKRLAHFRQALAACGLEARPEYIVEAPYTRDGGRRAISQLLGLAERPTAILASNDQQAIGALVEAQVSGTRVPDDVSIIGIDDTDAASATSPPLTTLHINLRGYGETAMRFLVERIEGRGPLVSRRRQEPYNLVVRGSTAPHRDS